jgi:hypothetical protein
MREKVAQACGNSEGEFNIEVSFLGLTRCK